MTLTYDKDKKHFVAVVGDTISERTLFPGNPAWMYYSKRTYTTTNFREARKFIPRADEKTKRLLERAFVQKYKFNTACIDARAFNILDVHQKTGVDWVLTRSRSYLAHAPGAGKTVEAIVASLLTTAEGQTVFIVPPSLVENWLRETERFTRRLAPGALLTVSACRKGTADWGADYIIVPDSMLHKEAVLSQLLKLRTKFLAIDEASRFKEASSTRTIALFGGVKGKFKSPGLIYTPRHAVLLDGSPMPNRSIELWAPTYAMCPEAIDFMSEKQFAFGYGDPKQNERGEWEFKGSSDSVDLRLRLQRNFMHVVSEDVLGHSARVRSLVYLEDGRPAEVRAWEKKWIKKANMFAPGYFAKLGSGAIRDNQLSTMRKHAGVAMVGPSVKYISERLESGESVLVFAWHREVVSALGTLLKCRTVMGGTGAFDREEAIGRFQGEVDKCLVMNIAAGGRGHNIQRADRIVFVEPSWSDEQNIQCEKRASRRGRSVSLPVKSDYLVVAGSVNELVLSSCFTKQKRVKDVIG